MKKNELNLSLIDCYSYSWLHSQEGILKRFCIVRTFVLGELQNIKKRTIFLVWNADQGLNVYQTHKMLPLAPKVEISLPEAETSMSIIVFTSYRIQTLFCQIGFLHIFFCNLLFTTDMTALKWNCTFLKWVILHILPINLNWKSFWDTTISQYSAKANSSNGITERNSHRRLQQKPDFLPVTVELQDMWVTSI